MNRHSSFQSLVLTTQKAGEDNRIITLLSSEKGVFNAMLYGGPKSRLRAMVSPWHSGTIWIYCQEAKQSIKITDFEPKEFRPSLRENIYKNMAASLATEIVIKTKAADESEKTWILLNGFLDGLELSDEQECKKGLLRFLWRYIGVLGERPEINQCSSCAESFFRSSNFQGAIFSFSENIFLCPNCIQKNNQNIFLNKEAMEYLWITSQESVSVARKAQLSLDSYGQLRQFLFQLINTSCGSKLKTFEAGIGIL